MSETEISALWALILCGFFAFSMHRDRSRYHNIVLLMIAAGSVLSLFISVFGKAGGIVVSILTLILLLLFLILPLFLIHNGFVMKKNEGKSLANLLSLARILEDLLVMEE